MKLILIRHGQTNWNTLYKTQGRTDEILDDTGLAQSALLAKRLEHTRIDAIYSSPLLRALQTAEAVAKLHGIGVNKAPHMLERDFGDWEGVTFEELRERYPELIALWREKPFLCTPPNAEPLADVVERCEQFLDVLRASHGKDDTIVVVGHSVPLRLMIAGFIGMPYDRMHAIWIDNVAVTIFTLDPPVLRLFNDTAHLEMTL